MNSITLILPDNFIIHGIEDFSPEENAQMLIIGSEFVFRSNKYVVGEKIINQLREEVRGEYLNKIMQLEEDLKKGQIIQQYLAENGEEKFQKEVAKMRGELEKYEKKIADLEVYYENKIEKEVNREKNHTKSMCDEYEKRIYIYKNTEEKLKTVCDYIYSRKSNTELGSEGEKIIQELCQHAFRDQEQFEMKDVHNQTAKGDYHLVFKDMSILVDSKLYTGMVSAAERDKIKRDLMANTNIHFAWLVSLDTPVSKFDKGVFAFEWINEEKCVCYINSIRKNSHPVDVIRSLYFVCRILFEQIILVNREKNDEEKENEDKKVGILEKFRENVIHNLHNYQKLTKDRDKALREMSDVFHSQDELIRISLNNSIMDFVDDHYSVIYNWWNANIVFKEGNNLSSQILWARFKKNHKEYADKINMENFKDILLTFVKSFSKSKGKTGKLEIKDVDFVEEHVARSASTI
jgi:hypothetical protein